MKILSKYEIIDNKKVTVTGDYSHTSYKTFDICEKALYNKIQETIEDL